MATTTNLGITLPTVGADDDTWGTVNNNAIIAFDALYVAAGSGTSVGLKVGSGKTLNALDGTVILGDAGLTLKDTSDSTKIAAFQCSGITAGQTRTYTLPDASGTLLYSGGALGTPASGTLTSCTGLPISTGVSGLGTGVATLLGGASSGTGGPAGTASPTLTGTPTLNDATLPYWILSRASTAKAYLGISDGSSILSGPAAGDTFFRNEGTLWIGAGGNTVAAKFTSTGMNSIAIGATTPGTGAFTTLSASSTSSHVGAASFGTASTTQGSLVLHNTSANSVTLKSSNSTSAAYTLTLPVDDGTSGQVLSTDGSGLLSWVTASGAEYGTWTPGISFGGGTTGITYTTQSATYAKSGRFVQYGIYILLSSKGSATGAAKVTGCPYTSNSGVTQYSFLNVIAAAISGSPDQAYLGTYQTGSATTLDFLSGTAASFSTVSNTGFTNTTSVFGSISITTT